MEEQNGQTIEKRLAEFDAPVLRIRLKLWKPIFQKWKDIYKDPKNGKYNLVRENMGVILNHGKRVSAASINLGVQNSNKPKTEIYKILYNSLTCAHNNDIKILMKKIIFEENIPRSPYKRGTGKLLCEYNYLCYYFYR